MSENNEIEAKIILPKTTYSQLCTSFPVKNDFKQENYYFDTDNGLLKQAHVSCRIRLFEDHAEQTLKVPGKKPVQHRYHEAIEINDDLNLEKAQDLLKDAEEKGKIIFTGSVGDYLKEHFGSKATLCLQTFSKTHRILAQGPQNCELTFDDTMYPDGFEDFELEVENDDPTLIEATLNLLKQQYGLVQNSATTNRAKIARAFSHRGKM